MRALRVCIVGFGTVGRWLAAAIHRRHGWLEAVQSVDVSVVSVATRRHGFIHCEAGFDIPALVNCVAAGRSPGSLNGAQCAGTALDGLKSTDFDVLAEASNTDPRDPEPALSHLRHALELGRHVITSSKGACAAAAVELLELARQRGVECRMESTVMSGTPVLSTIREGLAGARVLAIRGILNGTANHMLTLMAQGMDYESALADARAAGYAEPDPTDDVDGHDVVAKARILAALAFGRAVLLDQVLCRGIRELSLSAVEQAVTQGRRIKLLATVEASSGATSPESSRDALSIRVEPVSLPLTDPLARIDGVTNALAVQTDTVREVLIVGPGAGPEQAGQGMFADLVAVASRMRAAGVR
jgi:homoserine dehydrogenase